jgi:hypothetical protein
MNIEEILKNLNTTLGTVTPVTTTTPEQDAERKQQYEAEQADKRAVLRGLRNDMHAECERFNATYQLPTTTANETNATDNDTRTPTELVTQRERLQLTEAEWGALRAQAEYEMRSVANHISVILRKHLGTIPTGSTTNPPKRPVGRPPADKLRAPMHLQPWTPAIWEDEIESWHAQAVLRNPTRSPAEVRVAHNLYLETLFAHLQRVGFPHPFKAGFTAI